MLPDTLARALRDHLAHPIAHLHGADGDAVTIPFTHPQTGDTAVTPIQASPVFRDGPGFWVKVGNDTFTIRVTQD